ncbi:hypothetical protein Droror1_Dr00016748 [Drosera rotundifolia]
MTFKGLHKHTLSSPSSLLLHSRNSIKHTPSRQISANPSTTTTSMGNCFDFLLSSQPEPEPEPRPRPDHESQPNQSPNTTTMPIEPQPKPDPKLRAFDPRLRTLLETLSDLNLRRKDLFTRLISVHHGELVEFLSKMEEEKQLEKDKTRKPMRRCQSERVAAAAAREVKVGKGDEDLRLERFKVKTIDFDDDGGVDAPVGVGKGPKGGGGGGAKSSF